MASKVLPKSKGVEEKETLAWEGKSNYDSETTKEITTSTEERYRHATLPRTQDMGTLSEVRRVCVLQSNRR